MERRSLLLRIEEEMQTFFGGRRGRRKGRAKERKGEGVRDGMKSLCLSKKPLLCGVPLSQKCLHKSVEIKIRGRQTTQQELSPVWCWH